jgi:hypothetical protein
MKLNQPLTGWPRKLGVVLASILGLYVLFVVWWLVVPAVLGMVFHARPVR